MRSFSPCLLSVGKACLMRWLSFLQNFYLIGLQYGLSLESSLTQCGFRPGIGKKDMIFLGRLLQEKYLEHRVAL